MPERRLREVDDENDLLAPQPLPKRRRIQSDPHPSHSTVTSSSGLSDSDTLVSQALEFARTVTLMSLDSASGCVSWLRKRIEKQYESKDWQALIMSEEPDLPIATLTISDDEDEDAPMEPSKVHHSTPRPGKETTSPQTSWWKVPSTRSSFLDSSNTPPQSNGRFRSINSTPLRFPSTSTLSSPRSILRSKPVAKRWGDEHQPRSYRNRPHILRPQHELRKVQLQAQTKEEQKTLTRRFRELHKESGGQLTDEVAEKSLLIYSASLTALDILSSEARQLPESRSAVELRKSVVVPQDVHTWNDIVKAKQHGRPPSISGADADESFRLAVERANTTLKEPRPAPFHPTLDQLKLSSRRKDEEVEERLRPKLKPPQPLTPEENAQVDAVLRKRGMVSKFAREQVTDQDVARLRPCQWLNDEIINFYGAMILQRSEDCKENPPKGKNTFLKVHYFSTFFWPKLKDDGYEKGRLAKWTKKFDIFQKDVILIPVNHSNAHWTGAAINFRLKRIESYDSMGTERQVVFKLLRSYIDQEHRNKKKTPFDFTGWENHSITSPTQDNGFDCGVFTCSYLQGLSRGDDYVRFSQADMPNLRRRMIWEIGNARLHNGP